MPDRNARSAFHLRRYSPQEVKTVTLPQFADIAQLSDFAVSAKRPRHLSGLS
jgi:hypothetical protein